MTENPDVVKRRLLFLLHQGFVEIRALALDSLAEAGHDAERPAEAASQADRRRDWEERFRRIASLADVLEILPSYLQNWDDGHVRLIREGSRITRDNSDVLV
jgi:hypothetical protein